jgi:hypothetical protein
MSESPTPIQVDGRNPDHDFAKGERMTNIVIAGDTFAQINRPDHFFTAIQEVNREVKRRGWHKARVSGLFAGSRLDALKVERLDSTSDEPTQPVTITVSRTFYCMVGEESVWLVDGTLWLSMSQTCSTISLSKEPKEPKEPK